MGNALKFGNKVIFFGGFPLTMPVLAADPGSAVAGDLYYNSTSNLPRFYNGSAWTPFGTSGANAALSNLVAVAINTSLLPGADNSINLGSNSFSWATANIHLLLDSAGATSIDAYNRLLKDSGTNTSVDYSNRALKDSSGSAQLAWTTSGVNLSQLTISTALALDGSKNIVSSSTTATELGYVHGVTSAIQTQLDGKLSLSGGTMTGNIAMGGHLITGEGLPTANGQVLVYDQLGQPTSGSTPGVATLDGSGKIPVGQLPSVVMEYQGSWNPNTNTPAISDNDQYTFTIPSSSITAGTVYTNNGATFTVLKTTSSSTSLLTAGTGAPLASGTLTFVSGSPSGDLAFSAFSAGFVPGNGNVYWVSAADSSPVVGLSDASMTNFQIGDLVIYSSTAGAWQLVTPAAGVSSVNGSQGAVTVNAINQLTGDVTAGPASGSQSQAATIAAGAVTTSKLGTVTDGVTLDQSGAGSTLEVKTGGISNTQIGASAAIARSKLASGTAYAWVTNNTSGVMQDTSVTANRAVASDSNGLPVASSTTDTELGYVHGVTSAIQTQLNAITSAASGYANTALSNLATVAVNTAILPGTTNTLDFGSSSKAWVNAWVSAVNAATTDLTLQTSSTNGNVVLLANGTGNLQIQATIVRQSQSAASSNWKECQYFDSETLAANTSYLTSISDLAFALGSFGGAILDYTIVEASTKNQRTGRLIVSASNNSGSSSTASADHYAETAQLGNGSGLSLSAALDWTFTVTSANATAGATYADSSSNVYTVQTTLVAGTTLVTTGPGFPAASGTLTKLSGTGDATITYSSVAVGSNVEIQFNNTSTSNACTLRVEVTRLRA